MELQEMQSAVEAVLFTTGRAVGSDEIAKVLEIGTAEARKLVSDFAEQWNSAPHGTQIIELDDCWQMCTRKEYYPQLITLELHPRKPRLTDVLLETLSVVAYKQPVTKSEVERIRGVNSDHAMNKLVEFGLVTELGRAKLPGRPILFGTTQEFLRAFGVSSRETLPEISTVQLEDFREEAEEEADAEVGQAAKNEKDSGEQVSGETAAAVAIRNAAEAASAETAEADADDSDGDMNLPTIGI